MGLYSLLVSEAPMNHDNPYKELFSQPELIADLLRLAEMADGLDLDSLDRRNGSYVSEDWKGREDDVVWRVRCGDHDLYVYLLIEFQSTVDPLMAVRVMTYIGLLWQDLAKAGKLNPDGTLPTVLPLVLYNGEAPWTAPRAIHEAMGPVPRLMCPFQPDSAFLLLDEVRMHLRDGHERNLAAAVFRLERSGDPAQHLIIARTVAHWLRGEGKVPVNPRQGPHRARWGGRRATVAAYNRRSRCRHDSGGLPTESSCDKARG